MKKIEELAQQLGIAELDKNTRLLALTIAAEAAELADEWVRTEHLRQEGKKLDYTVKSQIGSKIRRHFELA